MPCFCIVHRQTQLLAEPENGKEAKMHHLVINTATAHHIRRGDINPMLNFLPTTDESFTEHNRNQFFFICRLKKRKKKGTRVNEKEQ